MIDREVVSYIKSQKQKGISDEKIRQELLKKALPESEIAHAFHLAESLLKEMSGSNGDSEKTRKRMPDSGKSSEESGSWSWGAFMLGPAFLIGTKQYWYLFLYLAYFIPLLNFLLIFCIAVFLGLKGRQLAYESTMFDNDEQVEGFLKAIDHAGKIMFILSIILFVIGIIFFITIFSAFFPMFHLLFLRTSHQMVPPRIH